MKTNKIFLVVIFVFANLLTFSQLKVLSTGNVNMGGGTGFLNLAKLNLYAVDNCAIFSVVNHSSGWGDAIKSQVNRVDGIAFSAYLGTSRNFMVFGNGDIWSATKITFSDSTLKTNINSIESPLEKLKKLKGVTYNIKSDASVVKKTHTGLLAQEVEKVLPDIVYKDEHGLKGIAYEEIIPLLIEAIKDQQIKIEAFNAQFEECCKNNSNLKSASSSTGTENKAQLDQNIPNPFSSETRISCFIPEESGNSVLYIYNMTGTQLQQFGINAKGQQSITINGSSFEPGMYLYALVIDGREVDTKRMILTK